MLEGFAEFPDGYTLAGACTIIATGIYTIMRERKTSQAGGSRSARRIRRRNRALTGRTNAESFRITSP